MKRSNSKSTATSTTSVITTAALQQKDAITSMTYPQLLSRKDELQQRLQVIAVEPIKAKKPTAAATASGSTAGGNNTNNNRRNSRTPRQSTISNNSNDNANNYNHHQALVVPVIEKTIDVHWDFTIKEMMWLATDFQAERKRQISLAKKIAMAVRQYHRTRESRRLRELAEAELKRRRLAARIGREVKGWWIKIERVIAYKQKCSADEERRKAMNKQLVSLVKQTEKYTESLIQLPPEDDFDDDDEADEDYSEDDNDNDDNDDNDDDSQEEPQNNNGKQSTTKKRRRHRKRRRRRSTLTIEEALAMGERSRRSKNKVVDYNRLHLKKGDDQLYGESTASDTGSDASFSLDDSDEWTDDESTLLEAEQLETKERLLEQQRQRQQRHVSLDGEDDNMDNHRVNDLALSLSLSSSSFTADPRELRILMEEQDMPIEQVLERYKKEMESTIGETTHPDALLSSSLGADATANTTGDDDQHKDQTSTMKEETEEKESDNNDDNNSMDISPPTTTTPRRSSRNTQNKKVTFALTTSTEKNGTTKSSSKHAGAETEEDVAAKYDADDDGDASDVEDFVESQNATTGTTKSQIDDDGVDDDDDDDKDESDDDDDGSDEFEVDQEEADDETTIALEEQLPQEITAQEEINLLKSENEMSVEELRKLYAGAFEDPLKNGNDVEASSESVDKAASETKPPSTSAAPARRMTTRRSRNTVDKAPTSDAESMDEKMIGDTDDVSDGSEEFEAHNDEADDETTMALEESLPQEMSVEDEIKLLKAENEMSVEDLRKLYAGAFQESADENDGSDGGETDAETDEKGTTQTANEQKSNSASTELSPDDVAHALNAAEESQEGGEEEGEFIPAAGADVDDETTIEAEEKLGRGMSFEEERKQLKDENEVPIEKLREMFAAALRGNSDDNDEEEEDVEPDPSVESDDDTRRRSKRGKAQDMSLSNVLLGGNGEDEDDGEDEFEPEAGEGVDDETTIEAEERLGRDMSYEAEIALLNKESEMSIEELREKYAGAFAVDAKYTTSSANGMKGDGEGGAQGEGDESETKASGDLTQLASTTLMEEESDAGDDNDEFVADEDEVDDETTMEAEERLGREISPEEELALLQRDSETPIETLYEMHQKMEQDQQASNPDDMDEDVNELNFRGNRKRTLDISHDSQGEVAKRARKDEDSDDGLAAIQALEQSAVRARQTLASRPFLLAPWVKLREYQQIGLNWLVSLQTRRLNGILADEMGLGKTLQTIALLAYLASYKGIWGPHLVIVPTSVIVNWETELKRFCPALKALCYYGSAKRRKELRIGWTKTNWYHVVVTSYQLAVQDAFAFKRKRWYYLILDEAQNIKNFQSQRWQTLINFNTQRRLLLTGTPLQNNLMELWSLLHFLMPYIFRSRKEFSYWFSNPMNSMIEGTANQNEEMIARLHGIIRPFVLRRLKKDVETQLPGKYEHIIKCPLSRRQMFFYEEFMARSSTRQALKKGGNYMGMMNVLMQLRKVVNHPDLFEPRSVVTPFVLRNITIPVPVCVVAINDGQDVFRRLSRDLLSPLWCGSSATPSLPAALQHDDVRSMALMELEDHEIGSPQENVATKGSLTAEDDIPPGLAKLLMDLDAKANDKRRETMEFQRKLNSMRCTSAPFPYSSRRLESLQIRPHPVYQQEEDLLSTPLQLLAMRRNHQSRADDLDETIKKFVFCVPKAGAPRPSLEVRKPSTDSKNLEEMLLEPAEEYLRPFRQAHARLTSFFPDKKLVQFDAGKLQTLAELLHDLKRGGHRVLIFTQMSKMLDILEAFLNLNGHTYVRLDGSTGVDRRQRLMDRFNNDEKIFSFILSTRSGGMGINLTGADTVIFYDSDWNPAMDAQAQDRAHRIGQTRDVHIYRLITEHSIEENILVKAQQKRNLDIIVMDKGKFDGSSLGKTNQAAKTAETHQEEQSDVFTKDGLRAILGVQDGNDGQGVHDEQLEEEKGTGEILTKEQMEAAMTNLEDQDDVIALRGAQKEAAEELQEFDESIELKRESDNEGDDDEVDDKKKPKASPKKKEETAPEQNNEEEQMVKEFAAWQDNVGLDTSALEASLSPTETYALHFRQEIEPFYSVFAIMEERRRLEASEETKDEIDIDHIEHEKAMEERRAIEDGDLLGTRPRPEDLVRQRTLYMREKARLRANKKRRTLTGENWELRNDAITDKPFWYNTDTGEAIWDKPVVIVELKAEALARQKFWSGLPLKPLVHIMSFLVPYPERIHCTRVCRQWRSAANDISFVRHVYPVEMGALVRDDKHLGHNHYRTIAEALAIALPGDTIELGDGHYWVNEPGLSVKGPIKLIGDEHNASNVVVEMSGSVVWLGKAGWVEGVTFRRPKISSGEGSSEDMLRILPGSRVDIVHSVIDNTGSSGASAAALEGSGATGRWENVSVSGGSKQGIKLDGGATLELKKCIIRSNRGDGISCNLSEVQAIQSKITDNGGFGAIIRGGAARFLKCHFDRNSGGILKKEGGCRVNLNHNTAPREELARQSIPGFQTTSEQVKTGD